jgi:hypothetical protein
MKAYLLSSCRLVNKLFAPSQALSMHDNCEQEFTPNMFPHLLLDYSYSTAKQGLPAFISSPSAVKRRQ